MTDELPMEDQLRRRARQGPRPDPAALFRAASGRADELRRRRRVGAVVAVVVVAVIALSVAATRRTDSSGVDTVGPLTTGTSPATAPPATTPSTIPSTDVGQLQLTGGILVEDGRDLVVIDPDTGARTVVLAGLIGSWSPDRRLLAATTSAPGQDDGLSVLGLDGGNRRQVYFSVGRPPSDPTWSPDGLRIAFTTPANNPDTLLTVNRDGGALHAVGKGRYPAWAADGAHLYANTLDDDVQIQRMDADGSNVSVLDLGAGQHGYPSASSTSLAYADFATNGISISDLDGSNHRSVTACAPPRCDADITPRWSPDGTRLAVVRTTGGGRDAHLVIVSAGTGAVVAEYDATNPRQFALLSWR